MPTRIDHFLIGTPDLQKGIDFIEALFGERPVLGGAHEDRGTINALLGLSNDQYVEIIAPGPHQSFDSVVRHTCESLKAPTFCWWAVRNDDLPEVQKKLSALGIETSSIVNGSRTTKSGELLTWKMLLPKSDEFGAYLPFFIDWGMAPSPAWSLTSAGFLLTLKLEHPKGNFLRSILEVSELQEPALVIVETEKIGLSLTISLETGERVVLKNTGSLPPSAE